jgi:hypothetical protein
MLYIVYDTHTGLQARRTLYKGVLAACRARDRLDLAYGAARYAVRLSAPSVK